MATDELIDSHVSLKQCRKAVEALHAHENKKEEAQRDTELLPGKEQNIWLNVTVKKVPSSHSFKPVKIPIVHPLIDPRTTPVCLITKDPQREYKDLLESHNIKFISRVVGIEKLKGKFKPFEARRMLLKENGLFLADERIIPLLPKLLGSKWFQAKKQPIPVCLTRKDLKGELEHAISSTYMNQNQGTCTSVKISTLSHSPAQILANIRSALPAIVKHLKGGWENVQSFHIKTNSSASLPIWNCPLSESEGGRWNGLTVEASEQSENDGGNGKVVDVAENGLGSQSRKGKKRASREDNDEDAMKLHKKSRPTNGVGSPLAKDLLPVAKSVQSGQAVSAESDASSKLKKRRSRGTDSLPVSTLSATSPVTTKTQDSDLKPKSRKAKPSVEAVQPAAPPQPLSESGSKKNTNPPRVPETSLPHDASTADVLSSHKKKKRRISNVDSSDTPQVSETAESTAPVDAASSGRKAKVNKADISPLRPYSPSVPVIADLTSEKIRQSNKMGKSEMSVSLSQADLKTKRAGVPGEKKKDKVVKKGSGGKSHKDSIIGAKVARG